MMDSMGWPYDSSDCLLLLLVIEFHNSATVHLSGSKAKKNFSDNDLMILLSENTVFSLVSEHNII